MLRDCVGSSERHSYSITSMKSACVPSSTAKWLRTSVRSCSYGSRWVPAAPWRRVLALQRVRHDLLHHRIQQRVLAFKVAKGRPAFFACGDRGNVARAGSVKTFAAKQARGAVDQLPAVVAFVCF